MVQVWLWAPILHPAPSKLTFQARPSKKERMELPWQNSAPRLNSLFFSSLSLKIQMSVRPVHIHFPFRRHLLTSLASCTLHESSLIGSHATIKKWDPVKNCGRYTSCSVFSAGKKALSTKKIRRINGRLIKQSGEVGRGDL